ncbi:MAG: T9SS type A sorting domain-containing protein [Bacteroidales bacterium]|nr:T9SS type A sorting domain-containing protein [Bacteroidales bacterium]
MALLQTSLSIPNDFTLDKTGSIAVSNQIIDPALVFTHYPNPVKATLTVEFPSLNSREITLRDVSGRMLYREHSKAKIKTLAMEHLPGGVYFLEVNSKGLSIKKKIIKQ